MKKQAILTLTLVLLALGAGNRVFAQSPAATDTSCTVSQTDQRIEICEGSTFAYKGMLLTAPSIYEDHMLSAHGCDSIIRLIISPASTYNFEEAQPFNAGGVFRWHGKEFTAPGVYWDSLQTVAGCDSVYKLTLTERQDYYFIEPYTICENEPLFWQGHYYSTPGTYYKEYKSIEGNDSIYELRLSVLSPSRSVQNVDLCEGEVYPYHGVRYTDNTVLYDTLVNAVGCDSIVQINLHFSPRFEHQQTVIIPEDGSYTWHGKTLTIPGVYWDSLHAVTGCDSIYKLTLQVAETYFLNDTIEQCGDEPVHWHGNTYTETGIYYDRYKSSLGADSIYALHLTMHPTYVVRRKIEICHGQTFEYRGKQYTAPAIVNDTMPSSFGCDSIVQLILIPSSGFYVEETQPFNAGGVFRWHGKEFTAPGVYWDSLQTVAGCDSVYKLTLTERQDYYFIEPYTICENEPLFWQGHYYSTPGTYYKEYKSIEGNDSIYELRLSVLSPSRSVQNVDLCEGEVYPYHGVRYTDNTVLYDTLVNAVGCDSIVQINLHFSPRFEHQQTVIIPEDGSYSWHGKTLTVPGVYWDSLHAVTGCDSIYKLTLQVAETYFLNDTIEQCGDEPVHWHGNTYTETGIYYDRYKSSLGADSIYALHLTMHPTYVVRRKIEICHGQTFEYRGKQYTAPAIVNDTMPSIYGCDSITQLILVPSAGYYVEETQPFNLGGSFLWHGRTLTAPGVYWDSLQTVAGCDSVYKLTLTERQDYYFVEPYTICENEPLFWHGHTYRESGTFYDNYKTVDGNDSIYELRLSVLSPSRSVQNVDLCEGEVYPYHGVRYTDNTVLYDTLVNAVGCDSIVQINLHFSPRFEHQQTVIIPEDGSYSWHGKTLTVPGVYWDSLHAVTGCDSIYKLTLQVAETYFLNDTIEQCGDEPVQWHGNTYTETGTYYDRYKSSLGADSIYALHLTMHPTYVVRRKIEICHGQTFEYRGKQYTAPAIVNDTMPSIYGCDSITQLILVPSAGYYVEETQPFNLGGSFLWHGRTLTAPGVYWDSLQTVAGCDSVYKLTLTERQDYYFIEPYTICASEPLFWHGHTYRESGTFYDNYKTVDGNDSIYELDLTVLPVSFTVQNVDLCEGDIYTWRGQTYTTDAFLSDTLINAAGCDSIVQMHVHFNNTYHFDEYNRFEQGSAYQWHGRSLLSPGVYFDSLTTVTGCDSIYKLTLTRVDDYIFRDTIMQCSKRSVIWRGQVLTQPGVYYDRYRSISGSDSIYELTLMMDVPYLTRERLTLCKGETFYYRGQELKAPAVVNDTLPSIEGCDSIVQLVLTSAPDYHFDEKQPFAEGASFLWHGRTLTVPGVYYDSLLTVLGCDSIYKLTLFRNDSYLFQDTIRECSTLPVHWRGHTYTESGIYYDRYKSILGTDSVYALTVMMNAPYLTRQRIPVCEGQSFFYRGKTYTVPAIIEDTLPSAEGCDSIIQLILVPSSAFHFEEAHSFARGSVYQWRGQQLTVPGVYWDSLQTIAGCDSVYKLTLYRNESYITRDTITECNDQPVIWHGEVYTQPGVYYDYYKSQQGTDSVCELTLQMNVPYLTRERFTLCEGQIFEYRGHRLQAPTVFNDTLRSIEGCDSVIQIILTPVQSYHFEETQSFSRGGAFQWHGRSLTAPGVYFDSLMTVNGCDSIYKLTLNQRDDYHFVEVDATCNGDSYYWHGQLYRTSGVYYDRYRSVLGTDSIYELDLTVYQTGHVYIHNINICEGDAFIYRGHSYSADQIIYDTLLNSYGCDSIVKIVLHSSPDYMFHETATVTQGLAYSWHGHDLSVPGIYWDSLRTVTGCDSVYRLQLTVHNMFYQVDSAVTCNGDSYQWHGEVYRTSGEYYAYYKDIYGVDSIYKLCLKINPPYFETKQIKLCPNGEFILRGVHHHAPEIFLDTITTHDGCDSICKYVLTSARDYHEVVQVCRRDTGHYQFGDSSYAVPGHYTIYNKTIDCHCDSIYDLILTVEHDTTINESVAVCAGRLPFTVNGKTYNQVGHFTDQGYAVDCGTVTTNYDITIYPEYHFTQQASGCSSHAFTRDSVNYYYTSGTYTEAYRTIYDCDSIYTLNLSFLDPITALTVNAADACGDEQTFDISYFYSGSAPSLYSVTFDSVAHQAGFTDIEDDYIQNPASGILTIPMPVSFASYCRPGFYNFILSLNNGACSPSSARGQLLVKYPASVIEQNWDDVVAVLNSEHNGGYTFSAFEWEVNQNRLTDQNGSVLYLPGQLHVGDEVVVYLTRDGETQAYPSCPLTIQVYTDQQPQPTCNPTLITTADPVTHVSSAKGVLGCTVCNSYGQLISRTTVTEDNNAVRLPALPGVYFLILTSDSGDRYNCKLIVK